MDRVRTRGGWRIAVVALCAVGCAHASGASVAATTPANPAGSAPEANAASRSGEDGQAAGPDAALGVAPEVTGQATRSPLADLALPPPPTAPRQELFGKRLDFRNGEPTVPVRLMENAREVTFAPRGRMRLTIGGPVPKTIEAPRGARFRVRILQGTPAALRVWVELGEFAFRDRDGVAEAEARWKKAGLRVRRQVIGALYGISGKVIDNRRELLLLDEPLDATSAPARQAELLRQFGLHTTRYLELEQQPSGELEVLDAAGNSMAVGEGRILAETLGGEGIDVLRVEYGVGYPNHGFEDRSYRGALELTPDVNGKLAVVNLVALEDLLKGLVPSEIFARAPFEALKAQAVTARGEVLAKIGLVHLVDPYLLCSEQHCAVYRGRSGEAPSTTRAVEATRGEALFSQDGRLVDSVYSAVCGGHTESNENVWGGPPDPNLRGRPDLIGDPKAFPGPAELPDFLAAKLPAACRLSSFAQPSKYRWEKRFTEDALDAQLSPLGVGHVMAISVLARGVSGRAIRVTVAGDAGATELSGELNIRRAFGMLNSSMFVVTAERDAAGQPIAWRFRGGGWGHGVGMCQTGAIGRAEAGQTYQQILRFYFSGAEVARIY